MNRILELRQQQNAALTAAAAVLEKARTEKRALTDDENGTYNERYADAERIRKTIEAEERQMNIEKLLEQTRADSGVPDGEEARARKAFEQWCRGGREAVQEELRSYLYVGNQNAHDFGASEKRYQSAITGNIGGYTVPEGFVNRILDAKKFYGGIMEAGPEVITTNAGNNLPWPTSNDTGNKGVILPENSPESVLDLSFDQFTLSAWKYSSRIVLVPIELLQDSGVDIEAHIVKKLAERLGRIQNEHFTTGTGTNQPQGVVTGATLGKSTASATAFTYKELIDLKYSVNRAYRRNAKWMMADTVLAAVLKLEDNNGRPLILDHIRTLQAGEPEMLLGQQLVVNDDMAGTLQANAKVMLYGDFENYKVRRVRAMMMMRLVERYAEAGQVAFLAFERMDGRLGDAGTNPIKYLRMQ